MKKILMTMVLGALMACLVPATAQNTQDWKSTSVMQTSGSVYAPQVTAVGATNVNSSVTTTESSSPKVGPRRSKDNPGEVDPFIDGGSPIGDAVLPLMLMAAAFGGVIALRRRKEA